MKFLLIDIGYDCEELNEPLGIEVLATYLKTRLPSIQIDSHCANIEGNDYASLFDMYKPDMIGISTHINTLNYFDDLYINYIEFCARQNISPVILVGGILGTYEYEMLLNQYKNTICLIGEGEESLFRILSIASTLNFLSYNRLISAFELDDCVNIAYTKFAKIVCTKRKCLPSFENILDLTEHKYLESILELGGIARIEASRGCPWNKCSFCVLKWKYAGELWRPYPWKKVIPEIIDIASKGANTIYFTDEEFLAGDYHRIQVFIDEMEHLKLCGKIEKKLEFVASTSTRTLLGKNGMSQNEIEKCLAGLKKIGFRSFFLGIESGCDSQLERFCKGSSVEDNEFAIALLEKYSIEADIGYILFDPFLTVSELMESLAFLKRNNLNSNISRFAKRLRLVPHTVYCDYPDIRYEQHNYNDVELIYKFNDSRIQQIFDCYSEWESLHLRETHAIQAEIRGAKSSIERNVKMERLSIIRRNEYRVLVLLVELAQELPDFCEYSIENLIKILERKL